MGVVRRQSVKTTLIQYALLPLGFIASIFIYPYNSETNDAFGLYNYVFSVASLIFPFIFLGVPNLAIKFFPHFKDETNGHNGLFTYLTRTIFLVLFVSITLLFLFKNNLLTLGVSDEEYITENRFILLPVAVILGLVTYLTYYISNFNRIVVPNFIEAIRNRIGVPLLILLIGFGYYSIQGFAWVVLFLFAFHLLLLVFYLWKLREFNFSPINKELVKANKKQMISFSLFAVLGTLGGTLCSQIDSIMITELIDVRSNGIYSIGRNISNVVTIPSKAIFTMMAPVIAKLIAENNLKEVEKNYKVSSNILLASGLFIFLALTVAIKDLIAIMNSNEINYSELTTIVTLLGVSILFNLITSINGHIIIYSKYYRFNVVLVLFLGLMNIVFNYYFIKTLDMGIIGAAYASTLSLVVFNLLRFFFIYIKMKMQPLEVNSLWIILLGSSVYVLFTFVSLPYAPIINIVLKETILMILFLLPVYYFKLSPELNKLIDDVLEKVKKIIFK